ncbi:hypothetical protein [Aestuariivirga litoralis]|uniref:hypothetical protein n=1 Tax=Aestuariivirga litoralis TaxID=2650924 RepID=UPI0018C68DED|nr:hypothetical protein [Aestuariivirga litoralis]MBG1230895.1 hypothetical protein [Aestuariivirga litoralis]
MTEAPVGAPYSQHLAAKAAIQVLSEAAADKVIYSLLAVAYLREDNPRRFINDRNYFISVARRFRSLGSSQFNTYSKSEGERRQVLGDLKPEASFQLGQMLMTAFGPLGMRLCQQEQERLRGAADRKQAAITALFGEGA